jgi:RNA polymerase sigma-70 factor (ECF subfamily)
MLASIDHARVPDAAFERRRFDQMVATHLPALRARAAQLCRGRADPDDVVQDALMRAFRSRDQMRETARARGWLLVIVTNTFLDSVRRRKARPGEVAMQVEPAAPARDDDDPSPWADLDVEDVRAAVADLPDDVRDTYRMFALEGRDYVAIAAAQGIPKATVGTRILRARKRLRDLLVARAGGAR